MSFEHFTFESFTALMQMHGYAAYVWPAWAVGLGTLALLALHARLERQQLLRDLYRRSRRERGRHESQA